MHHTTDQDREIAEAMGPLADQLGATGEFPGGRLTPNDQGQLFFGIGVLRGKVVVDFGKEIRSLGMSPNEARAMAKALRDKANEIDGKVDPKRGARGARYRRLG